MEINAFGSGIYLARQLTDHKHLALAPLCWKRPAYGPVARRNRHHDIECRIVLKPVMAI